MTTRRSSPTPNRPSRCPRLSLGGGVVVGGEDAQGSAAERPHDSDSGLGAHHAGPEAFSLGDRLTALPLSTLWTATN